MATARAAHLDTSDDNGQALLSAGGSWTVRTVGTLEPMVDAAVRDVRGQATIDISEIDQIDTAGAWLLTRLRRGLDAKNVGVEVAGASSNAQRLLDALDNAERVEPPHVHRPGVFVEMLEGIGETVVLTGRDFQNGLHIMGGVTRGFLKALRRPALFRFTSVVFHMDRTGFRALPIVSLMSVLVGAIIAQQSAFQLKAFGADLYVVDLVGILVLRELGVLLTAIMVAGRSGSAYTAEIGSMKMREEVDALQVIGLDPIEVLILPRILGLILVLPLLAFVADLASLFGAGLVAWIYVGITPQAFISRLRDAVALNTLFVGLLKAPFMALIIGIIAAAEGLSVRGSAASLGAHTTSSVVKSIFMVIVVDGIFAIYFAAVNY